jgi:DNA-binding NarL/FixJ family response regulator
MPHFRVHGRSALARKLQRPPPAAWTTKREKVRHHLAAGLWVPEIAARMGITTKAVWNQIAMLRKAGECVRPRGGRHVCEAD